MNSRGINRQLARFVDGLSFSDLPAEVIERTKTLVLDALATAIAGRNMPYPSIALRIVKDNKGRATVFTYGLRIPAMDAAFVNSIMGSSIAQDDMLYMFHPGAVVIPAALAISEEEGRTSGSDVITAIVAAYEVMGRVYLGAPHIVPKFRGVPVFGPFGAAVASGKLIKLDEDQLTNAFGYAANLSSGLSECWIAGTMEARIQTGLASRNGIMAAFLAREGAIAAETSLEGKAGFYQAFAESSPDIDALTADLGKKYLVMEAKCKIYPVCGLEQAPIDLALTLAKQHGIQGKDIARITEILPEADFFYPGTNYPGPFATRSQATMSAQFCAASAFLGKPVMSYSFFDESFDNPEIAGLSEKIELVGEKGREKIRIEVILLNGRKYCIEGGGPEMLVPSIEKTRLKFENLTHDFLGSEKVDKIADIIFNLEKIDDVKEIIRQIDH